VSPTFCYHPGHVRILVALSMVACRPGSGQLLGLGISTPAVGIDGGGVSGEDGGPESDSSRVQQ
jgi:hypothetical protein